MSEFTAFRKNLSYVAMIANMNEKANRSKLLAAVLAMALIAVCGIVVLSDSTAYAEESEATQDIGYTDGETTATVYSAEQLRTVLADAESKYSAVTTIVIGGPFTVDHVITVNKNVTIDGNGQTITAIKSATFTGVYVTGAGATNKVISIENTDATIENLTIDNAKFAFGLNVYGSGAEGVVIENVTSNNSAGAGFVIGQGAIVTATNISATGYIWGGVNADKGATVKIDAIDNIGSIYTENSTGTTTITDLEGQELESNVEIGIGSSGEGYFNGYYVDFNEAAAAYSKNVGEKSATIDVNADASVDSAFEVKDGTVMNIADGAVLDNNSEMKISGTVSGTIDNQGGSIAVTGENVDVTGLTVDGGSLTAPVSDMPIITDGTVVTTENGISYSAFTVTRNGYDITIGVGSVQYNGNDFAGEFFEVSANVLKVVGPNDESIGVESSFMIINAAYVYQEYEHAVANDGEYGVCIDANDYYILIQGSVSIPGINNFNISTVTGFTVLPMTVDIHIVGSGENGAIPDQTLIDGSIGLAADKDFYVWADFNGNGVEDENERLNPDTDYTFDYDPKVVGESTLTVTPTGNYTGDDATKNFNIVKELESITVELANNGTFYVGEKIESSDLIVTAYYGDGTSETVTDYVLSSEYVTGSDMTSIEVSYGPEDNTKTASVAIDVIAIDSVVASGEYNTTYELGDAFDLTNVVITVTYADEANVVFTYTAAADETPAGFTQTSTTVEGATFSTDITFDPEDLVLDFQTGEDVQIGIVYFDGTGTIEVTVTGYLATYMYKTEIDGDWIVYGTQYSSGRQDLMTIFNMVFDAPEGYEFAGWQVNDTSAVYQPGDSYAIGEDENMWATGNVVFYAIYNEVNGDTPITPEPVEESKDILVSIVSTDTGVNVYLVALDGGYIPAGTITGKFYFTYQTENSGIMTVPVDYSITITEEMAGTSIVIGNADFVSLAEGYFDSIVYVDASFGDFDAQRIMY